MNIRKFLRDFRTGRSDYSSAEAAAYLGIKHETFRQLVRAGVIQPLDGGGADEAFIFRTSS